MLNSRLDLFSAAPFQEHPFSLSYGVNLPSSLTTLLPLALEFSSCLPVSVCGTGASDIHRAFLACRQVCFPTIFQSLSPGATNARVIPFDSVPLLKSSGSYGISTVCASATPSGLTLAPGLPGADEPSSGNLRLSANMILTYFSLLIPAFSLVYSPHALSLILHPVYDAPLPFHSLTNTFSLVCFWKFSCLRQQILPSCLTKSIVQ